jgi:hypothetical protein
MIRFAIAFIALVLWGSTAFAAPDDAFGKALMARIKSEGFRIESIKTTLLRRIQIDSKNSRKRRQTVYNPVTGVVLRDAIFGIDEEGFLTHVNQILGGQFRQRQFRQGQTELSTGAAERTPADRPGFWFRRRQAKQKVQKNRTGRSHRVKYPMQRVHAASGGTKIERRAGPSPE